MKRQGRGYTIVVDNAKSETLRPVIKKNHAGQHCLHRQPEYQTQSFPKRVYIYPAQRRGRAGTIKAARRLALIFIRADRLALTSTPVPQDFKLLGRCAEVKPKFAFFQKLS